MAGPDKSIPPASLFASVISRGKLPHATVDFPRYDGENNAVAKVYLRVLTQKEQDLARANACKYVADVLSGARNDVKWKPDELEDNALAAEILAVACRHPDDPEKPFFPHGVIDARDHCTPDELGILLAVYAALREQHYPALRTMTEQEMWLWTKALEEGADQFPFSRLSRPKLEGYCVWAAKSLASLARALTGTTSSTSPSSPSSDLPDASSP